MTATWYIPWYVFPLFVIAGLNTLAGLIALAVGVEWLIHKRREGGEERENRATIRNLTTKLEIAEVRERRLKTLVNELREGQNDYGKISP